MSRPIHKRKDEVIDIILNDPGADRHGEAFNAVRLRHRALPEINLSDVDPAIEFMGKRLSFPLLLAPMTGGVHARLAVINRHLAEAAEAEGVAMGVGSQRVMFAHPEAVPSFAIRKYAPSILLFSNLGAVQLNHGFGLTQARKAVKTIGADALCLHLNSLQETVQPEGETEFAGLAGKIGALAAGLEVPVILREVGAGISPDDARLLVSRGIRYLDVGGWGGLSWSRIEQHRHPARAGHTLGITFQDWGLPTPEAISALAPLRSKGVRLIATGGVRTGIDMAKAMVLGASLCGMAAPFLAPAMKSTRAVRALIQRLRREFVTAMFLMGARRVSEIEGRSEQVWSWDRTAGMGHAWTPR